MKIVFGLLSSKNSAAAVAQFAQAVWPHTVLVHHDFAQCAAFEVRGKNIFLVEQPVRTKWGDWSLVEATSLLMRQAVERFDFDYFQLVSESCLPIRPIDEFVHHLATQRPAIMINRLLVEQDEALYNFGWRYLSAAPAHRRILRRAGLMCLGRRKIWRAAKGVNLRLPQAHREGRVGAFKSAVGRLIIRLLLSRPFAAFPMMPLTRCWAGSQWFGASRQAILALLQARQAAPALARHYAGCPIPDESYFHTLIDATCAGPIIDGNHLTVWAAAGFGPDQLGLEDLPALRDSRLFFARKFSLDPACALRMALLEGGPP